eukprot:763250-Hanusia_phi.AAC.4
MALNEVHSLSSTDPVDVLWQLAVETEFLKMRNDWLKMVKMASRPQDLLEVLRILITSIKGNWLRPWFHDLPQPWKMTQEKKDLDNSELLENENENESMNANELATNKQEDFGPKQEDFGPELLCNHMSVGSIGIILYALDEAILYSGMKTSDPSSLAGSETESDEAMEEEEVYGDSKMCEQQDGSEDERESPEETYSTKQRRRVFQQDSSSDSSDSC